MATPHDHAPAWLFSFVDLAFLLLIAMTQLGPDGDGIALDLGEIVVPRVRAEAVSQLPTAAPERWQLRVHPAGDAAGPFELLGPDGRETPGVVERLDARALHERLGGLRAAGVGRPLVAPHEDSRSQDLLDAVAVIEEHWSGRRAAVSPTYAQR